MNSGSSLASLIAEWRHLAIRALPRMFRPEAGLYAFRLRRGPDGRGTEDRLEGVSPRYTAIVLIAAAEQDDEARAKMLEGTDADGLFRVLGNHLSQSADPGEAALTLWAARRWGHPLVRQAMEKLKTFHPASSSYRTVELSWALSALSVPGENVGEDAIGRAIADRLLATQDPQTGLFAHWAAGTPRPRLRGHVCCFADMVYPVLALAQYHARTGDPRARVAALACGRQMGALQGPAGQWWWHFDIRTARVVEKYPVYAVHQDGMAPMALGALQRFCGGNHMPAVERGCRWLENPPEVDRPLVDRTSGIIWRKVCRREPNKLCRGLQTLASAVHPALRVPAIDRLFPPRRVDWETRPYHMAWLLYAWPAPPHGEAPAAPESPES